MEWERGDDEFEKKEKLRWLHTAHLKGPQPLYNQSNQLAPKPIYPHHIKLKR